MAGDEDGCSSPGALIFLFRDMHEATSDVVTGRDRRTRRGSILLLLLALLVVVEVVEVVSASRRRDDLLLPADAVSFVSAV